MSIFKWTAYNAADTAIASASLNALGGSGSYALGAEIDNTTGLYLLGDLVITLSSAVSVPAGAPNVIVWILPAPDGSYPVPPGTTAGAASVSLIAGTIVMVPSVSTSKMVCRGLVLPPSKFKIQIQNNLGIAFPSTSTGTCLLYRYGEQSS